MVFTTKKCSCEVKQTQDRALSVICACMGQVTMEF